VVGKWAILDSFPLFLEKRGATGGVSPPAKYILGALMPREGTRHLAKGAGRHRHEEAAKRQTDSYYASAEYDEASAAYRGTLELDPGNAELQRGIQDVEDAGKAEAQVNH
jgi:hypothetical protein